MAEQVGAGPELRRLGIFVGEWKSEGQQHEGPFGPDQKFSAIETFEWLPGGFFLVHRLNGHFGDDEASCIEISGWNAASKNYPTHTYYNNGILTEWKLEERDGTWTRTGEEQLDGKTVNVRCTTEFTTDGRTMTARWEYEGDGSAWTPFLDATVTKA